MTSPVVIPASECVAMRSTATGLDYEVFVWRPTTAGDQPLPCVFALDGNVTFPVLTAAVPLLLQGAEISPVQVVGIGYPLGEDAVARQARRRLDLVPARRDSSTGAEGFFRFLADELKPWLDERYALNGDRALLGVSLGGLFAVYTLLNHASFFSKYVIVSPAIAVDQSCYDDEARLADEVDDVDATVYLTAGDSEDRLSSALDPSTRERFASLEIERHTRRLAQLLESRRYPNLNLTTCIAPGQTHFTLPFAAMIAGLCGIFGVSAAA